MAVALAVLGSMVIVLDPIYSGLAWRFNFGIIASTLFSLVVIPVLYFLIYRDSAQVVTAHSGAVHAVTAERARCMNDAKLNYSKLAIHTARPLVN